LFFFLTFLLPGITVLHSYQACMYRQYPKAVQLNHTPQFRFYIIQEEKIVIEVVKLYYFFF